MIWLSVKRDVFMQNFQHLISENSTFKRDHVLGGLPNEVGAHRTADALAHDTPGKDIDHRAT